MSGNAGPGVHDWADDLIDAGIGQALDEAAAVLAAPEPRVPMSSETLEFMVRLDEWGAGQRQRQSVAVAAAWEQLAALGVAR
jgi:hypothetical protein